MRERIIRFWDWLSYLGVKEGQNYLIKRQIVLTNRVAVVLMTLFSVRIGITAWVGQWDVVLAVFVASLGLPLVWYLNHRSWIIFARVHLVGLFYWVPLFAALFFGYADDRNMISLAFVQLTATAIIMMIFDYRENQRVFLGVLGLSFLFVCLHDRLYLLPVVDKPEQLLLHQYFLAFKAAQLVAWVMIVSSGILLKQMIHRFEREILNLQRETHRNNLEIAQKNEQLVMQQHEIELINRELERRVDEKTHEVQLQNERLIEYAYFNAHKVRGPLARILGLCQLIPKIQHQNEAEELLPHILKSAKELDEAVHEIHSLLED